jgi:hypothetical protein
MEYACKIIYVIRKMIPAETIPRIGKEGIKNNGGEG